MRSDRNMPTSAKYQRTDTIGKAPDFSGDNRDQHSFILWASFWIQDCLKVMRDGGAFVSFIDWRNLHCMIDAVQVAGLVYRGIIAWDKTEAARPVKGWFRSQMEYAITATLGPLNSGPDAGGICQAGVIRCTVPRDRQHATQKPVELIAELLKTRDDWQTVLDPFAGSGTTLVAARDMGRKAIGIEIEERYCEIAANRLSQGVLF